MLEFNKNETDKIVKAFKENKILAFPTDTVYGVGVRMGIDNLKRLKQIKNRM